MPRTLPARLKAVLAAMGVLLGAGSAQCADLFFDGKPVTSISGITLGCKSPYALARDCSGLSGATRQVPALPDEFRVASSADGTIVLVMSKRILPGAADAEHDAALMVRDVAATVDATLLKAEAVTAGPRVLGYVLTFDRAVYETLLTHPRLAQRATKPQTITMQAAGRDDGCRLPVLADANADRVADTTPTQVPRRRYLTVVRDSGRIHLMRVGTTVLTNATTEVALPNPVLACARDAVNALLSPSRGFEAVQGGGTLPYERPAFGVNLFDGYASLIPTPGYRRQEEELLATLAGLASDHGVEFIVVIADWGDRDTIDATSQPLEGYGIYQHEFLGTRRVEAYATLLLQIYDASSRQFRLGALTGTHRVETSRWVEFQDGGDLPATAVEAFVPDIVAAVPAGRMAAALCELKLLPVRLRAPRFSLQPDCDLSYPAP